MKLPISTIIIAENLYQHLAEEYAKPYAWDIALDERGTIVLRDPDNNASWTIKVVKEPTK